MTRADVVVRTDAGPVLVTLLLVRGVWLADDIQPVDQPPTNPTDPADPTNPAEPADLTGVLGG